MALWDAVVQVTLDGRGVDHEIGRKDRYVAGLRTSRPVKLSDSVDRVVIVEREQQLVARIERVRLADELESLSGVGGKDHRVDVRGGVKERQHAVATRLDQVGRCDGRCVL